jgi:AcrR family transcriptional regulator
MQLNDANSSVAAPEGLRERKRRATRQRIAKVGLRMFLDKGFDATTLDMIAVAANISRRSFFHYFESKDAVLVAWESEVEDAFRTAIASQPERASPGAVMHGALANVISRYETDESIAIDRLMRSTEELRVHKRAGYERLERNVFVPGLALRWPSPQRQHALQLVAMVAGGALRIAVQRWSDEGYRGSLARHLDRNFATLRTTLAD